jgi:hypothetical protein
MRGEGLTALLGACFCERCCGSFLMVHTVLSPLASLRGERAHSTTDAAIHLTRHSLKDGLSAFAVILEGTPHRKCHIEDPPTALLQTKT